MRSPMRTSDVLLRSYDALVSGLALLAGAMMAVMAVSVVVDVCIRTAGLQPPGWTVPLSEYLLLYVTLAAAPWVLKLRGHVLIDSFVAGMPGRARAIVAKAVYALCAVGSLVVAAVAADITWAAWIAGATDVRAVLVPKFLLTLPFVPAFALMAVEFVRLFAGRGSLYDATSEPRSVA